jgi:hypothetical protein
LLQIFSSKEEEGGEEGDEKKTKSRTDQAKDLLAKYGGAYLATSITLSIISFTACYLLINAGVDVQQLLAKVRATPHSQTSTGGAHELQNLLMCPVRVKFRLGSRRTRPEGRSGHSRWPTRRTRRPRR